MCSTIFDVLPGKDGAAPPIGKPVPNTQVYVLNDRQQVVPIGVPGELFLGGVQLARGYLNRQDLTDERFFTNPFVEGGRIYKTGDSRLL